MRRAARKDDNQQRIVDALRAWGCSVEVLNGPGLPDLAVGRHGVNVFLEVKNADLAPSARKLTQPQKNWHAHWHGQVAIVETVEEALQAVQSVASESMVPF